MSRFAFVLLILILSLVTVKSLAVEVNDLYKASVVVDSQSSEQREQAIQTALAGVFLKVGGKKSVLSNYVLKRALRTANQYVSQYHYQRKEAQLSLVVAFNENMVNTLFKKAKLALWGSLRPQVLLWLIDEQGTSRTIVSSNAANDIPSSVNKFSELRGLPIAIPLMDAKDSAQLVINDFWEYFPEEIKKASSRYLADTIVVMRLSDSSLLTEINGDFNGNDKLNQSRETVDEISCGLLCVDEQQVIEQPKVLDWRLQTQGALYTKSYQGINKENLINQALSDITELIYQSYAFLTSAENDFIIEVKNVSSLKSDSQLFQFLKALSAVKNVTLISAYGDSRRFKLDLIGSQASFLAALKLDDKLTPFVEPQLTQPIVDNESESEEQYFDVEVNRYKGYQGKVIILGQGQEPNKEIIVRAGQHALDNSNTATLEEQAKATDDDLEQILPSDPSSSALALKTNELIAPAIPVFIWEQG